jgi:hypothetical protein
MERYGLAVETAPGGRAAAKSPCGDSEHAELVKCSAEDDQQNGGVILGARREP